MSSEAEIRSVLETILDPEMPINIVDLGIVVDVRRKAIETESSTNAGTSAESPRPGARSGAAEVRRWAIEVDLTPTFVGCPALEVLKRDIVTRLSALPDVDAVSVRLVYDPPWSTDRISNRGREALRAHGVTTPVRHAGPSLVNLTVSGQTSQAAEPPPDCPFCGGSSTLQESAFGPTRCRMIYYCPTCMNSFEHLKRI